MAPCGVVWLQVSSRECGLLVTEPLFNFKQVQAATEQVRAAGVEQHLAACRISRCLMRYCCLA